jgi:hypothetical protein
MQGRIGFFFVCLVGSQMTLASTAAPFFCAKNNQMIGALEKVVFTATDMKITARVDTGAGRSSLHAKHIQLLEENEENYVQFYAVDDLGNRYKMKEKLQYMSEITNTSGIPEKRYVIRTQIVLKNKIYDIDVNLKDRSNMQYKFLIGRDLLKKGGYVVKIL